MRPGAAIADRRREVRAAAREWRAAELVDDATLDEIDRRFADDRVRAGPVIRLLLFVLAFVAGLAAVGLFTYHGSGWPLLLVMGLVFWALTELQTGRFRRSGGGVEEATSVFAVALISGGLIWALDKRLSDPAFVEIGALVVVTLAAAAAWRWGMPAYGAAACVALFVFVAQLPAPRMLWLILAAALAAGCEAARRSARLAPAHRGAAAWTLAAALALAYLSVNPWSWDKRVIERLADGGVYGPPDLPRWTAILLTASLPLLAVVIGAWRRDRLWLWTGVGMVAATAVTLRHYVHLAPLWVLLASVGAAIVATALLLQRWLDAGLGHERRGITAQPLFGGHLERSAEVVATLATLGPAARVIPTGAQGGLKPGGGTFGGGGASESF